MAARDPTAGDPTRSVPFTVAGSDWQTVKGVAYVDGDDLVLDTQAVWLDLFQRPPCTHRLDLTDLDEVRHTRRWPGDRLVLRTRPLERLAGVPGVKDGVLTLKVGRKHRAALEALLERLDLWRV